VKDPREELPPDLVIERASLADIAGIMEVERACFRQVWAPEQYANELLDRASSYCLVARTQGRVIGTAAMTLVETEAHITSLAVRPPFQGRGLGDRLLRRLLDHARRHGVHTITLEVRVSNAPALHLYRKHGFRALGRRPHYYTDTGEDALVMVRDEWGEEGVPFPRGRDPCGTKGGMTPVA